MSRIWSTMDIAKRSLMNSQTGLQTVSHNIANKASPGYSRQRVETQAQESTGRGPLRIGSGARASTVTRVNNPYLEKQLENEKAQLGYNTSRSETLYRVEELFNEQTQKGLNKYMSEFFNSFRELSNSPESHSARTLVKESADFLTKDFRRVHDHLTDIQNDVDFQIATKIEKINGLTQEISQLNQKVTSVEMQGRKANDERDRRDHLIKELGGLINIKYTENDDGQVVINAGRTALLVAGVSHRPLEFASTEVTSKEGSISKREGHFDVLYRATDESHPTLITDQINGGSLGGLLDVRDKIINKTIGDLDNMAYTLAHQVNEAHQMGFNRNNQRAGEFFKGPAQVYDAAKYLNLSETIANDAGAIAAGAESMAPGDNRVANVIAALQFKQVLADGTSTLDNYYGTIVGDLGIKASRANSAQESQAESVKQLQKIRDSISGVSLDEETTKMIEYQKAFDASARLIRTADEMLETVLNIKRY